MNKSQDTRDKIKRLRYMTGHYTTRADVSINVYDLVISETMNRLELPLNHVKNAVYFKYVNFIEEEQE